MAEQTEGFNTLFTNT